MSKFELRHTTAIVTGASRGIGPYIAPGPGRTMRALVDRFPGVGPRLNRMSGAEETMQRVVEYREREMELARGERVAQAGGQC